MQFLFLRGFDLNAFQHARNLVGKGEQLEGGGKLTGDELLSIDSHIGEILGDPTSRTKFTEHLNQEISAGRLTLPDLTLSNAELITKTLSTDRNLSDAINTNLKRILADPTSCAKFTERLNQEISAGTLNFSLRHVDKPNILSKNGLENFLVNLN